MDLDGRTRQFFSVLSERLKEKGFSSRIADDGCLAVKSKKMRGKEQTQCSVGKDGEVYCRSVDFANISRKRDLESILETVNEVHSDMEISNSGPKSYETATVMKMPASFAEFSDALQKARIKDGSFCKNELTCIHYNGLTHAMIGWNANLYDLNLFAQRLASLTEEQKKGMDALLKIKQNHRVAPIPLNQLINLTYNTDICCFAPRVSNHEELGAFLYANEMLSNEAMALLDTTEEGSGFQERLLELLGEQHQEDHGGVFTDFGYAELGGEIKDIYVCQSNETACFHRSDAPVVLEVRKGFFNDPSYDNDKTAVLNLPAADAGIWRAVEKVDAASVDECAFRCVDCLIPFLRDAINNAIDDEDGIEQADEFAKRLAQIEREWPESDMVKYKALLSVVDHPSLQDATRLMGEIDQYELRPEVAQTWGYAEMMFREKYSALPEELFQTPQAAQIGQKMLDDRLGVITEYGLIRRKDGQPLPVFQPEQEIGQGLEMM